MATQAYPDIRKKNQTSSGTICERGVNDRCELDQMESQLYQYYLDFLKDDIKNARSTVNAILTDRQTADNSRNSILCCQEKADATYNEYLNLDYCLSTVFDQGSDDLKLKITDLMAKDQTLVSIYQRAHKAIKDLKQKTGELKDVACKLKYAIPDPCNSEQVKALRAQIKVDGDKEDFDTITNKLITQAEAICAKANLCFEISVKVAGIHAYLNVAGLKPLSDAFVTSVDNFKRDVDTNITFSGNEWRRTYTDYLVQLRLYNNKECSFRLWQWKQYSLCKVKDFVCEPKCDPSSPETRLKEICDAVEGKFVVACPENERPPEEQRQTARSQPYRPNTDL